MCLLLRLCTIYSRCKKCHHYLWQRRLCLMVLQEHQMLYSVGFSYRVCLTVYSVHAGLNRALVTCGRSRASVVKPSYLLSKIWDGQRIVYYTKNFKSIANPENNYPICTKLSLCSGSSFFIHAHPNIIRATVHKMMKLKFVAKKDMIL